MHQSDILQTINLPIVSYEECKVRLHPFDLHRSQICAGGQLGKDSCSGDSGGPMMLPRSIDGPPKYYLIGVVSFGDENCGGTKYPALYTKVADFMNWILDRLSP